MIRTRFAPSPTGHLHVGGVRTALFSWLFARHHGGEFLLRIEDTDRERSTQASVEAILQGLEWLGLKSDAEIVYQSQRFARYHHLAEDLLARGRAYRCTCTKERLEALRAEQLAAKHKPRYDGHCRHAETGETHVPHVVRFKNPQEGAVQFTDQVYGDIVVSNQELDDLVIIRSDGHPTYNFAVVVDDWDMQISHIIRGDDHINNTPRQINLYEALGAPVPVFAHLPMILGADGKRLSKRHGAVSVLEFQREGYLAHTLLNYLVRLGWSAGDQEIFNLAEMIDLFDLKQVSRGSASFNYEKLQWLNQHYIKSDPVETIIPELARQYAMLGITDTGSIALQDIIPLFADRAKTLSEMAEKSKFLFAPGYVLDPVAFDTHVVPIRETLLPDLYSFLAALPEWEAVAIHDALKHFAHTHHVGLGKVAQPLRVIVTGGTQSPSIDHTLVLLGRTVVLSRIQALIPV